MKKLILFCKSISNTHLTKDIVIIPYLLQKYFGYDTEILTNSIDDELIDNKKYLDNLKITLVDDELLNQKLADTDLLILFGLYNWNFELIHLYKSINPLGKIYLKLDANMYWMFNINKDIQEPFFEVLRKCTLITTESRRLQHLLNMTWRLNIKFIPNGYYNFVDDSIVTYEDKENIIMFSGRVGSIEKRNTLLLNAFKDIEPKIPNWKIELVGPVEDDFLIFINNYFRLNPHLKDKVKLIGNLNKKDLKTHYKKAKIFCITSDVEACANVFSEAICSGCYIISSDVDGAIDIVDYGKYGRIIPANNLESLRIALLETCLNENMLKENCLKSQSYAKEKLHWVNLCDEIYSLLS